MSNTAQGARMLGPAAKNQRARRLRKNIPLYTMFIPVIVYFLVFKFLPMGGLVMAFQDFKLSTGITNSPYIGLTNFRIMLTNPIFRNILRNTFLISLGNLVISFPIPILMALMINEIKHNAYKSTVQTVVFMPHFLNWVIVGSFVVMLFSQESGVINEIIRRLGGQPIAFLYQPVSWFAIFFGSGIWKEAGWGAILYLAAMAGIAPELYESAVLDGASRFKRMLYITLPSILPVIIIRLILSVESVMQVGFEQMYVLSNSAVSSYTNVISLFSYNAVMQGRNFGITTAMGLVESLIGMLLMIVVNALARRTGNQLW